MNGAWLSAVVLATRPVERQFPVRPISLSSRAVQRRAESWTRWPGQRPMKAPLCPEYRR